MEKSAVIIGEQLAKEQSSPEKRLSVIMQLPAKAAIYS
jgi:hypothetical protein